MPWWLVSCDSEITRVLLKDCACEMVKRGRNCRNARHFAHDILIYYVLSWVRVEIHPARPCIDGYTENLNWHVWLPFWWCQIYVFNSYHFFIQNRMKFLICFPQMNLNDVNWHTWGEMGKAPGFHWDTEALPERLQRCVGQRGHPHGAGWELHPLGRWCGPHGSSPGWSEWSERKKRIKMTGEPCVISSSILCSLSLWTGGVLWGNHQEPWGTVRRRLRLVLVAVVAWRQNLATCSPSPCAFSPQNVIGTCHTSCSQDLGRLQEWFMLDSSLDGNSLTIADDWYQIWCYHMLSFSPVCSKLAC